jgi:hypothetical protein
MCGPLLSVMTPFKKRMLFCLIILVLLGLDEFAGHYLFGKGQTFVAFLCMFVSGFALFYFGFKDRRVLRNDSPEVYRRKRALWRLLRAKSRKSKPS